MPPRAAPRLPFIFCVQMAEEQEVTMSASIRTMTGIGPQAVELLELAGFRTIGQLRNFDQDDRRLQEALNKLKSRSNHPRPESYWRRLSTRCINVIYRARSAHATDYVPCEYMCPLTLDWYDDPVVAASGVSYSRHALEDHMRDSQLDPTTDMDLTGKPIYDNTAMRDATDHYRLHYQRFRILS